MCWRRTGNGLAMDEENLILQGSLNTVTEKWCMDHRFLKWMGEALYLYASNLECLEKLTPWGGVEKSAWSRLGENMPALSPPPFSPDEMDAFYREWLSFLGAVPKSDVQVLQKKVTALEEECDQLRQSIDMLVQGLSGVRKIPAAMNQWVDLTKTITSVHREWLEDFRRHWEDPGEKEVKKHGRKSKKLERHHVPMDEASTGYLERMDHIHGEVHGIDDEHWEGRHSHRWRDGFAPETLPKLV